MPVDTEGDGLARRDRAAPGPISLRVLGSFELRVDGVRQCLPTNVERVLALLAVRVRPQKRVTVASTLWLDTTEERAAANLRTALWKSRQAVGCCVEVRGHLLGLAPGVEVDLAGVIDRTHRLLGEDHTLAPERYDPSELDDDLLPDWDEDWILFERERVRQLRIHALETLCRRLSEAGHGGRAVDAGLAAVAAEPLRESAQRALIGAHLREHNVSEARRQYHWYRELLWESLGIEPSEALRTLVEGTAGAGPRRSVATVR